MNSMFRGYVLTAAWLLMSLPLYAGSRHLQPPPPPFPLRATAISPTEIQLSWPDHAGPTNGNAINIERSTDRKLFLRVGTVAAPGHRFQDSGLFPGRTYFYRVSRHDSHGDSRYSNIAQAHTAHFNRQLSVARWGNSIGDPPAGLKNIVAIAAGNRHCLALKRNGTVVGWGDNSYGQATPPAKLKHVIAIAAGMNFSLALRRNGTVVGWGDNGYGQATPPSNLGKAAAIAAGNDYGLALLRDGTVTGWGNNRYGQAIPPANLRDVVAIAAGSIQSLALQRDGLVVSWGSSSIYGDSPAPQPPPYVTNVVAIATGGNYNLALKRDGTVVEWNYNGTPVYSIQPSNLTNIVAIAAGASFSLALKADGSVTSWEYNLYGAQLVPKELNGAVSIAAGDSFSLALTTLPSAPLQPGARITGTNQIRLSWIDNSQGEKGFVIERAPNSGLPLQNPGTWTRLAQVRANVTTYTDNIVETNAIYWYRIRTIGKWGDSLYTDPIVVGVKPPPAPDYLATAVGAPGEANLSWYENSGLDGIPSGYRIEKAPDVYGAPGAWMLIGNAPATNATQAAYTDTNVTSQSTWWYRVQAFNVLGNSPYSAPAKLDLIPPVAPGWLSAAPFANQVMLDWDIYNFDSSRVDNFQIERAPDSAGSPGSWQEIATLDVSNHPNGNFRYTDADRELGQTYWYRVRAHNWIGNGGYSSPASATIVLPSAPIWLTGRIGSTNQVNLSWYQTPPDATGYRIERAPDVAGQPGNWVAIGTIPGTNFTSLYAYTDTNTAALTTNWYRIQAFNVNGNSGYTSLRMPIVPPPAPAYFVASTFRDQVKLRWDNSHYSYDYGLVTSFQLERASDRNGSPGNWSSIAKLSGDVSTYTDSNRPPNMTFWYRIQAVNWIGGSNYSSPVNATIVPPWPPNSLTAQIGTTNQIVLGWYDGYGDEDGFYLERAPDAGDQPGAWSRIATVQPTNDSFAIYSDTNAVANSTNWYRVKAFNFIGESAYTTPIPVAVGPPPAPGNFTATAHRDQIKLSWTGANYYFPYYGEVAAFRVERAPDTNGNPGNWSEIATVSVTNLTDNEFSYSDPNLAVNITYWYRVQAVNWIGFSQYSATAKATVVPPPAPSSLIGIPGDSKQIRLSWYESSLEIDGFRIQRAPDANGSPGPWTEIASVPATNNYGGDYTDTNVAAYSTNWYRVRAFNVVGDSQNSSAVKVSTIPPSAPSNLSATPSADRITLSWNDYNAYAEGVDQFQIDRALDVGGTPGTWKQIAIVAYGGGFGYPDSGLTTNTTYWYRVRAHNWIGNGEFSPPAHATILPPAAPYGLNGMIGNSNQVNLSWNENPSDENGFLIERAPDENGSPGNWMEIGFLRITNAPRASYTDTNVVALTTNWYRVCSFNALGNSPFSVPSAVAVVPPPPPDDLAATTYRDQINLTWSGYYSNYTSLNGFTIQRALDTNGKPGEWTELGNIAALNYSDHDLTANSTYWYRVRANNWVGNGVYSLPISATIIPPAAPYSLYGQVTLSTNEVKLHWFDSKADEDGFELERAPDTNGVPGTWVQIATLQATNLSSVTYNDTNAPANTTNWYRVRAYNQIGLSDYSPIASVAVIPPPPPTYFYVNAFRDRASLTWYNYSSFQAVEGYKIERALDVNGRPGTWTQIAQVADNADGYIDSGLTANTTYWYRVRAFNWVGDGTPSAIRSATIIPPAAPTSLYGRIGATNQVNLFWTESQSDEDGFQIERAPDTGGGPGAWTEIGLVQVTNSSSATYTDTNVTALTTNWYRVRSFNLLGTSAYSPPVSVAATPPPHPYFYYVSVFSNEVNLSWYDYHAYDYGNIDGYQIERALNVNGGPGTWAQIAQVDAGTSRYTDSGLSVNTGYWYRLRAFNWIGEGEYSSAERAIILPPAAPTALSGYVGSTNQVQLSWRQNQGDEDGFLIDRAPDNGGTPGIWVQIGKLITNGYDGYFTDTNAVAFTTNWYRVRAFNSLGTSQDSDATSVAVVPPRPPYSLTASVFRRQINLSWYSYYYINDHIDGYKIERAPDQNGSPGTWTQIAQVAGNANSYNDPGLSPNVTYWYRVRPFNWVGDGEYSPTDSATIIPPIAPRSLACRIGTTNQIKLSWYQNPADEDGFQIEKAPDVGGIPGTWTKIGTLLSTNMSNAGFTDTNATALVTNWYRVRAFNDLGTSDPCAPASIAVIPPPAPYYLSASAYRDQIKLSWYVNYEFYGSVDGYKVERAPDINGSPGTWSPIAQVNGTTTSYNDSGHALNTSFWYRVKAFNWTGDGQYSPVASATISLPTAPSLVQGRLGTTNQILLSWEDSHADEDGFRIERAPDAGGTPGQWSEIGVLAITNASYIHYTDTNVSGFTTNWYRVRAFNALGVSDYSSTTTVKALPPSHPQNLTAFLDSSPQVNLSWQENSDYPVEGYLIERATNTSAGPGTWEQIARLAQSYITHYNDASASPVGSYWYRVRAYNWVGESPNSPLAGVNISRQPLAPYATDSATLHLWHLDELTTPCIDCGSGHDDLTALSGGASLGAASAATLGKCLDLQPGDPSQSTGKGSDAVLAMAEVGIPSTINYCDAYTRAFTYEAIVHVEFDPAKNYGPTNAGGTGRNTPFQIINADGNSNSQRIFQFRIDPIGFAAFNGDTSTNLIRLEFINLNAGVNSQHILAAIPTTGAQAIISNNWYHVAVCYSGTPNVPGNIKFYWTRLDTNTHTAALLDDSQSMSQSLAGSSFWTIFTIGNAARNPFGSVTNPLDANFPGRIDEVRISSIARAPSDMLFTNAPASATPKLMPSMTISRNVFRVNWHTVSGNRYQIQYKTNLSQSDWIDLGNPLTATNSITQWSEPIVPDSQRFYRLQRLR